MSKNNSVVLQARAALDQFKMEAAREVGVQSPYQYDVYQKPSLVRKGGF